MEAMGFGVRHAYGEGVRGGLRERNFARRFGNGVFPRKKLILLFYAHLILSGKWTGQMGLVCCLLFGNMQGL